MSKNIFTLNGKVYIADYTFSLPLKDDKTFEKVTCVFFGGNVTSPNTFQNMVLGADYFEKLDKNKINSLNYKKSSPMSIKIFKGKPFNIEDIN